MASPPARRGPRDDRPRHPRPGGGDGGRRPRRRDERGPDRADGHAARPLRAPGERSSSWASSARSTASATPSCARTTSRSRSSRTGRRAEAMVERIVHLGFEVRVELVLATAPRLRAGHPRRGRGARAGGGQIVFVRPSADDGLQLGLPRLRVSVIRSISSGSCLRHVGDRDRLEHRAQARPHRDPHLPERAPPPLVLDRPPVARRGRLPAGPRRRGSPRRA